MLIKQLLSKRWIVASLLAIVAVGVMVRLGVWQLDRLEQRRTFNDQVLSVREKPPLELAALPEQIQLSETYRQGIAVGEFDYANEVILSNQSYRDQLGVHLLTPMKLAGSSVMVLVDRGWGPFEDYQNQDLAQYQAPGAVEVAGILADTTTSIGVRSCVNDEVPAEAQMVVWCVDLEAIQARLPYEITPLYLVRAPAGAQEAPPIGTTVQIEITEGPHLGYAMQWFGFAIVLAFGYPIYVYRSEKARTAQGSERTQQPSTPGQSDPGEQAALRDA
jgi:surfeit locus 1 family protein